MAAEGLERFRRRARRWEKRSQPVAYVGIVELARTLSCGFTLLGRPIEQTELWQMLE